MADVIYISKIENTEGLSTLAKDAIIDQSKVIESITYLFDECSTVEINNTTTDFFNVGKPKAELRTKFRFDNGLTLSVIWLEGLSYGCERGLFETWFWMNNEEKESDDFKEEYAEPLGYQTIRDIIKEVKKCLKLIS